MKTSSPGILVLAQFMLLIQAMPSMAFVHASGTSIVDADGNPALVRGMGLGGWLVPEGYMLHTHSHSPTTIRNDIIDVVGEAGAEQFYAAYHENYVTREDIHELAEWGFDHVRMPFHYNMFSPYRGVWNEWGFEVTDSLIAWCSEVGMHVVLDMHCAPGGQNGGNISDSDGTARLWLADSNKSHTIEIWEAIAQRYAEEVWVGGYDLLNEPVLPNGVGAQDLRSLYVSLRNVIRAVDNNHILFIEGNWYATDFTGLTPIFDLNMAYSFHKYWSTNDRGSIQTYLNMRGANNVPLWMGESGENSNTWFRDAVVLLEENNVGWCWWTTKKFETITSPYSASLPPDWDLLVNYWAGSGSRPDAQTALGILMEFAENLRTENCSFSPGVVASWFSPDFSTQNVPFKDHMIPGTILTADYDIGAQDVAYHDDVYQTVQWDNYTAWNNGHQYRNDGVDIQVQSSGIPNIGWTSAGEWLKYTFQAEYGGIYELSLEIAHPSQSSQIRLFLDDEVLTTINTTPITGGWDSFEPVLVEDLDIGLGEHELMLQILNGSPNMRAMEFILDSVHTWPETPETFTLGQNFPNPFNAGTTIPVSRNTSADLVIEIYDIRGHLVKRLDVGPLGEVFWEGIDESGKNIAAGTYVYRIVGNQEQQAKKMLFLP